MWGNSKREALRPQQQQQWGLWCFKARCLVMCEAGWRPQGGGGAPSRASCCSCPVYAEEPPKEAPDLPALPTASVQWCCGGEGG